MQWSKTKSTLESFLCEKLQGRIKLYATVYRKFHDGPARVWITFDGKEIISAPDVTYQVKHEELYRTIQKEKELKEIPYHDDFWVMYNSPERQELVDASDQAKEILNNQNIFSSYDFYSPFMKYSSLSIEQALTSDNVIIRAFAMFDRRLGKRRLQKLQLIALDTHPLIIECYKIRCEVEGIEL